MKPGKFAVSVMLALSVQAPAVARDVVIKSPEYFTEPIREGQVMFPDSLVFPEDAEQINISGVMMIGRLGQAGFTNLKKVTFGDIDYIPGGLFMDNNTIEEIEFNGMVGHFDCSLAANCPNLRKVTFHGPVSSTGGPGSFYNCQRLDSVVFESVVGDFGLGSIRPDHECHELSGFINNGAFLKVYDDSAARVASIDEIKANPRLIADLEKLADWQSDVLTAKNPGWMRHNEYQTARVLLPVLEQLDLPSAGRLKEAMEYALSLGDEVKTHLDFLKEAPAYSENPDADFTFRYAAATDSMLTAARVRFNLDSIAGNGDDISRIKNLLYWVHDNIRHDGSNGLAPGPRTLANNYDSARRDSCGYNCRALAICLTEALLAEGIPARYITCLPKAWDTDSDCHVICVAWSDSLGKWIWVDPTFAAYVTDENGLLLHPGEVRYRLQNDLPLTLNADANWNGYEQDPRYYLNEYMTKNLYFLEANTLNQAEPEGPSLHDQGKFVTLVPTGMRYPNSHYNISDEALFWQSPR